MIDRSLGHLDFTGSYLLCLFLEECVFELELLKLTLLIQVVLHLLLLVALTGTTLIDQNALCSAVAKLVHLILTHGGHSISIVVIDQLLYEVRVRKHCFSLLPNFSSVKAGSQAGRQEGRPDGR